MLGSGAAGSASARSAATLVTAWPLSGLQEARQSCCTFPAKGRLTLQVQSVQMRQRLHAFAPNLLAHTMR